jgi:hypothetical protein
MYLVELQPGQEAVYGTLTDFVDAVRRGEVGWEARIYHRAKSTWIPVALHPHFKKVAGERPADPPRPAPRRQWTFLRTDSGEEDPAATPAATTSRSAPASDSKASGTKPPSARSWRKVFGGLIGPRRD